jgi:hypothetical protein
MEINYQNFTPEEYAKQFFSRPLESFQAERFMMLPNVKEKNNDNDNKITITQDGLFLDDNNDGDEPMDYEILFQIMLEITLYGLKIINPTYNLLTINVIEDLDYLNKYLNKMYINLNCKIEEFEDVNEIRNKSDWYCQINYPLPEFLSYNEGWKITDYQIFSNRLFEQNDNTPIEEYRAIVRNKNKIFYFWFNIN